MQSSLATITETEVDLATGIVLERVRPLPRRRRGAAAFVVAAALAGLLSGWAAEWLPAPRKAAMSPQLLGTAVRVAALRSDPRSLGVAASRGSGVCDRAGDHAVPPVENQEALYE